MTGDLRDRCRQRWARRAHTPRRVAVAVWFALVLGMLAVIVATAEHAR
jgi:hypothetical protein